MVHGVPVFDGDLVFEIDHAELFIFHTSKENVVHKDVFMLLFMSSLYGYNSWLHNHEPQSISSIKEFFECFLRHFQVCPTLNVEEEAFIEHHHHLGNLDDGK